MADDSDQRRLGERLKELREQAGLSQEELGRRSGLGQTDVSKMEHGQRRFTLDKAVKLASVLGRDPAELLPTVSATARTARAADLPPSQRAMALGRSLPVRGVSQGGRGRTYMLPDNRAVDLTFRPPPLENVPDAYALFVFENSMTPMFRHSHTLWVHPHLPPVPGEGVVIVMDDDEVLVKELVRRTDKAVTVREYFPADRKFDLAADRIKFMHAVVGSFRR